MQRAKAVQAFDRDLKEAISDVRKDGYKKALAAAHDPGALSFIEHEIRSDFQLTRNDRLQLLGQVELASASFGLVTVAK